PCETAREVGRESARSSADSRARYFLGSTTHHRCSWLLLWAVVVTHTPLYSLAAGGVKVTTYSPCGSSGSWNPPSASVTVEPAAGPTSGIGALETLGYATTCTPATRGAVPSVST